MRSEKCQRAEAQSFTIAKLIRTFCHVTTLAESELTAQAHYGTLFLLAQEPLQAVCVGEHEGRWVAGRSLGP